MQHGFESYQLKNAEIIKILFITKTHVLLNITKILS